MNGKPYIDPDLAATAARVSELMGAPGMTVAEFEAWQVECREDQLRWISKVRGEQYTPPDQRR